MKYTKCPVRRVPTVTIADGKDNLSITVEPDGFLAFSIGDQYVLVTEKEAEELMGWLTTNMLKQRRKSK